MSNIHTIQAMKNKKSAGVTILLFLFFGVLGAHRFYTSGVKAFNVIYLLTGGFFCIGLLIDLFLVWTMASKANDAAMVEAQMYDSMIK